MRLSSLLLASLFLVLPVSADLLGGGVPDVPDAVVPDPAAAPLAPDVIRSQPTSLGQAILGFEDGALPAVQPGDSFHGFEVVKAVESGAFLVVRADDVGAVRQALAGEPGLANVEGDLPMKALVTPNDPG